MIPSVWTALKPNKHRNSLLVLKGSHRDDVLYWLFSSNAKQMIQPGDQPNHPDGESLRLVNGILMKNENSNVRFPIL